MTRPDSPAGRLATVVDLAAERRDRRPQPRPQPEEPLTHTQRAVLRRMRSARKRLLTRSS